MTLLGTILRQVQSVQSMTSRVSRSPPPEPDVLEEIEKCIKRKRVFNKYAKVRAKVDSSPPRYSPQHMFCKIPHWTVRRRKLDEENVDLIISIKKAHFARGRVDSRWKVPPKPLRFGYVNRVNALKRIMADNKMLYKRISTQGPKVVTTESLLRDWARNRSDILARAQMKFVLFPPIPKEHVEDPAFLAPPGVKRPRAFFTLRLERGAEIGELQTELFTDICPKTCKLFTELLLGDGVGFSYVGTHFFRKVPNLYWVGGDVARDNGFGCYAQKGRQIPIGAENYHFSHTIPGLLSMPVTCDDEVCGIFNITFKPLQQIDLRNIVFGRIVRPSRTFEAIKNIGKLLSPQPLIVISESRMRVDGGWVRGVPNTLMIPADAGARRRRIE